MYVYPRQVKERLMGTELRTTKTAFLSNRKMSFLPFNTYFTPVAHKSLRTIFVLGSNDCEFGLVMSTVRQISCILCDENKKLDFNQFN
jgi:hypothetical protein